MCGKCASARFALELAGTFNFIRRRSATVRFIRRVSANLARAMPALIRFVCAGFVRTGHRLRASRLGFRKIL